MQVSEMAEAIERIRVYCDWSRRTHCAGSGDSIEELLTDERPAAVLVEASERTGHIVGCRCTRCDQHGYPCDVDDCLTCRAIRKQ